MSASIVADEKRVRTCALSPNVAIAIRSPPGFAATNARAARIASASALPFIERDVSIASRTLFARPRFCAV